MRTKEQDLVTVQSLQDGQEALIAWAEEGGGVVRRVGEVLKLYEVGQYGGFESFVEEYPLDSAKELVDVARSWT